jgi:hypothetical protein
VRRAAVLAGPARWVLSEAATEGAGKSISWSRDRSGSHGPKSLRAAETVTALSFARRQLCAVTALHQVA